MGRRREGSGFWDDIIFQCLKFVSFISLMFFGCHMNFNKSCQFTDRKSETVRDGYKS